MTADAFTRLIAREAGVTGSDRGGRRRGRTRGPKSRHILCHPSKWWSPDLQQEHIRACQSGRDAKGEWKSDLTSAEAWALIQELGYALGHVKDVIEIEVP